MLKYLLSYLILPQLLVVASSAQNNTSVIFSGLYEPNLFYNAEDFAASFLISKARLLRSELRIKSVGDKSFEDSCLYIIRHDFKNCTNCITTMTRDYFDYMVEHLSSTTNNVLLPNRKIYDKLIAKMKRTRDLLRRASRLDESSYQSRRGHQTLVLIVYSSSALNSNTKKFDLHERQIRRYYFEATFWSTYRHFKNVAIAVGNGYDAGIVESLSLPYHSILNLLDDQYVKENDPRPNLPKYALLQLIDLLKHETKYNEFQYIMHIEADNILHIRSKEDIFDAIDIMQGNLILVPHRMQTLPTAKGFPKSYHHFWDSTSSLYDMNIQIISENYYSDTAAGSCCDNGRYVFQDCGSWWYHCKEYGLKNHNVWLRFGRSGYTMPLSTEHQATCSYSRTKKVCELPPGCNTNARSFVSKDSKVCGEYPVVRKVPQ